MRRRRTLTTAILLAAHQTFTDRPIHAGGSRSNRHIAHPQPQKSQNIASAIPGLLAQPTDVSEDKEMAMKRRCPLWEVNQPATLGVPAAAPGRVRPTTLDTGSPAAAG